MVRINKNLPRWVIEQQHQDDQPFGMHSERLLKGLSMGVVEGGRGGKRVGILIAKT
jgi:hypothetical protein